MLKLTALFAICVSCSLVLSSCEKDTESEADVVSNFNIPMTRSNNVPATTGTGRIEATLDKKSKILTYKVTWSGLSSNAVAMHIHGLGGNGMIALPVPLGPFANGLAQNITGFPAAKAGTHSGSLYVDDKVIKISDLVAGQYYLDIHTVNFSSAMFPAGEIRGQLSFSK